MTTKTFERLVKTIVLFVFFVAAVGISGMAALWGHGVWFDEMIGFSLIHAGGVSMSIAFLIWAFCDRDTKVRWYWLLKPVLLIVCGWNALVGLLTLSTPTNVVVIANAMIVAAIGAVVLGNNKSRYQ